MQRRVSDFESRLGKFNLIQSAIEDDEDFEEGNTDEDTRTEFEKKYCNFITDTYNSVKTRTKYTDLSSHKASNDKVTEV